MANRKGFGGPKPKPTELKKRQGTYRSDKATPNQPVIPDAKRTHKPPDYFNKDAVAEWKRMLPVLTSVGVLKESDLTTFTAYCHNYGLWMDANRVIAEEGTTQVSINGEVKHRPEFAQSQKALQAFTRCAIELGLTPSSRTRINAEAASAGTSDDDDIFG